MALQALTRHTSPYLTSDLWDAAGEGFTEEFKPRPPKGTRVHAERCRAGIPSTEPEAVNRMRNHPDRSLWPWEGRCRRCRAVRDKTELKANGGRCPACTQEEIDAVLQTSHTDAINVGDPNHGHQRRQNSERPQETA